MSFCSPIVGSGIDCLANTSGSDSCCPASSARCRCGDTARSLPNIDRNYKLRSVAPGSSLPHSIVVVPCYNEAQRLDTRAFMQFRVSGHWVEFLFVNDGSRDGTLELLQQLRCASPDTV